VRLNGKDTARPVVTGVAGDSSTAIVSGLKAGDLVVLPVTTLAATSSAATTGLTRGGFGGGGFGGGGFGGGAGGR
jgi:membrane fusion protein, macrolide-specific efflux system